MIRQNYFQKVLKEQIKMGSIFLFIFIKINDMSDYIAEQVFKVFIISEFAAAPAGQRVYGLVDTHGEFDSYEDAQNWIQGHGDRQRDYSIIDTWRKK